MSTVQETTEFRKKEVSVMEGDLWALWLSAQQTLASACSSCSLLPYHVPCSISPVQKWTRTWAKLFSKPYSLSKAPFQNLAVFFFFSASNKKFISSSAESVFIFLHYFHNYTSSGDISAVLGLPQLCIPGSVGLVWVERPLLTQCCSPCSCLF